MSQILKRVLSLVLALTLVLSVAPVSALSVLADENDPTQQTEYKVGDTFGATSADATLPTSIPENTVWYQTEKCIWTDHTHTDDCFKKELTCEHTHIQSCYDSYEECKSYIPVLGYYTCDHAFHYTTGKYVKTHYGSSTLICDHEHTDDCYSVTSKIDITKCPTLGVYEHTHTDKCFVWKLYDDVDGNGKADGTDDDPYYTLTFMDGLNGAVFTDYIVENVVEGALSTSLYKGDAIVRLGYTYTWGNITEIKNLFGNVDGYTCTAEWKQIDYTITWDHGEGSWADANVQTNDAGQIVWTKHYGDKLTAPAVTAPANMHFLKWTPVVNDVTESVKYTAEFTNDTIVYVTYYIDNVKYAELPINVSKNEKVKAPADPADEKIPSGQMFVHWDQDLNGKEVEGNTEVHAVLAADVNGNKVPDKDETISVSVTVSPNKNAGEVVLANGNHTTVTKNEDGSYSVLYDSTKSSACTIKVNATAGKTDESYTAYYLSDINDNGPTDLSVAVGNVKVTFTLETFSLRDLEDGEKYEIGINGFSNDTKAVDLKKLVLDAVLGAGKYNIGDYTVEMLTSYDLGNIHLGEGYYNVEGYTIPVVNWKIPASYFVGQLTVDGVTANTFKVTKLADSNKSKVNLYIEGISVYANESRKNAKLDLTEKDYTQNTLDDVLNEIKKNVTANGEPVKNVTVTVADKTSLTTTKQKYTVTVKVAASADYLETTKEFEIFADICTYTVTWNINGDETKETYAYGTMPTAPKAEKTGYTFTGWDKTVANVTGHVTYTAKFEVNKHNIKFYYRPDGSNEGEHVLWDTVEVAYGTELTWNKIQNMVKQPVVEGYTFSNWGQFEYYTGGTMPDNDLEFTAIFKIKNYVITWKYKDKNGIDQKIEQVLDHGTKITVPSQIPTSYTIGNVTWTVSNNFGIPAGAVANGNVTYTAKYTNETVWNVYFKTDKDADDLYHTDSVSVPEGGSATATKPADPKKDGYRFDGWYLGDKLYDFSTPVTSNITLTAKWVKLVTVSFDVKGIEDQIIDINTKATKPDDPTKSGFVFAGWYLDGKEYDFSTPVTKNITLSAKWEADTNNNGVADKEETIKVTIIGNGSVTIGGKSYVNGDEIVYDSTKADITWSLKAKPVTKLESMKYISSSYVSAVRVDNDKQKLTYAADYSVSLSIQAKGAKSITVVFGNAQFEKNKNGILSYYVGMKGVTNENVYNAAVASPAYGDATEITLKYLAREATTAKVSLDSLDIDSTLKSLLSGIGIKEFTFNLDELWLDVNVEDMSDLIEESVSLDQAVATYLTKERIEGLYTIYTETRAAVKAELKDTEGELYQKVYNDAYNSYVETAGTTFGAKAYALGIIAVYPETAAGEAVTADINAIYTAVSNAAMYYGAHNFGYNPTDAETVDEIIYITYKCDAFYIEGQTTVTLKDTRENSYLTGKENTEIVYRDFKDEDLVDLIGIKVTDVDGKVIDGAIVTSVAISDPYTFEDKNVSQTAYEITFKFAGNEKYKPSEATYYITVVKADASIELPNVMVTYGTAYSTSPDVTLGNKYGFEAELTESMIYFVVGLGVKDDKVNITDEGLDGLASTIQLMLPKSYMDILETLGLKDGITLSLSDMNEYLDKLGDLIGSIDSGNDVVNTLINALKSISELIELPNVNVTIGGKMPTNVGLYLYGAISTSGNYKTAMDTGYIVITPDATKVELEWNHKDSNGIFTQKLLQHTDLGAHASDPAANEKIHTLFFGVADEGKLVFTWDQSDLGNGAYTELAFIAEFGNEMYYAMPIGRAFVIVPNLVDVEISVDGSNANNTTTIFDNAPIDVDVKVDLKGLTVEDSWLPEKTLNFYGVLTNGETYNSTKAPTHAGVYVATATVIIRDENGELMAFGADVVTIVIKPAQADITVDNKIEIVGGTYDPADQVGVVSGSGVTPDTTIIIGAIGTDGTFSENGMSALVGNLNIDFPQWVDVLINKYAPSVVDGITVKQFSEKLVNKLPQLSAMLEEKGIHGCVIDALNESIEKIAALLADVPENVTLSFQDHYTVSNVGVYMIVGVVTDYNHVPAVDAGYLVITPDVTQVELKWNYEDKNGVWTRDLLDAEGVDLWASAYKDGVLNAQATAQITYQFIGVNSKGEPVIYTDVKDLPNGAYLEVAYIKLALDGQMVVSDIIARPIVIAASGCNVSFSDVDTIYNGQPQGVGQITVTDRNGNIIDITNGKLTVTYVGVTTKGESYNSTEKPVDAGAYSIIVTYIGYDNGQVRYYGAKVGKLTIGKAEGQLEIKDTTVTWDGEGHFVTVVNPNELDYLTAIVDRNANTVNFILENDTQALLDLLEQKLNITIQDSYDVGALITKVHEWVKCLEDLAQLADVEQITQMLNALDQLLSKLPHDAVLYINGAYPSAVGTYECYIVSYSYNYQSVAAKAVLKIVPLPADPEETTKPVDPEETTKPVDPEETTKPTDPEETTKPTEPADPTNPTDPTEPGVPTDPTVPTEPGVPTDPTDPEGTTKPTDPDHTPDHNGPTTGDHGIWMMAFVGAVLSLCLLCVAVASRKKNSYR